MPLTLSITTTWSSELMQFTHRGFKIQLKFNGMYLVFYAHDCFPINGESMVYPFNLSFLFMCVIVNA